MTTQQEIEARFRVMAVRYAKESIALQAWVQQGNKLPECYRETP